MCEHDKDIHDILQRLTKVETLLENHLTDEIRRNNRNITFFGIITGAAVAVAAVFI